MVGHQNSKKRRSRKNFCMTRVIIPAAFILCFAQVALSQRWLSGTWEGKGYQTNSDQTWTAELTVQRKKFLIKYPSLECSGEWKLIGFNKFRARFRENIKVNQEACEPIGDVILQRLNNNQILFLYSYRGKPEIISSSVFNRIK